MKSFVVLLAFIAIASSAPMISEDELEDHFTQFKDQFGRSYSSKEEEFYRKRIFANNLEFIFNHNRQYYAGLKSYTVAVNNFTDLSNKEFRAIMNGLQYVATSLKSSEMVHEDEAISGLPDTVDWTTKGVVTPIKNQEDCGSCWAFSAVASIEGQHALKTGKLVSLSEQNLVDCSTPEGNDGCDGGLQDSAFQYVIKNHGIDTEQSYQYKAVDESCRFNSKTVGATISSYVDVKTGSEAALQTAVANIGPISVGIDASQNSFQFYSSGVYDEPNCSTSVLDHGVTAVGYGTDKGIPYWKVKNSWGTGWGISGYILMSRLCLAHPFVQVIH